MAETRGLTNGALHEQPDLSASMMQDFYLRGPAYYAAKYITGELASAGQTPAKALGAVVHCLALEPDAFGDSVAVAPDVNRKTKAGKSEWAAFVEESAGKTVIKPDELQQARDMASAVRSHPLIGKLMGDGYPEVSIFWRDEATQLDCKCRVDWLDHVCLDLKTSRGATPAAFAKQAASLGYHRARVHYLDGIEALTGERPIFLHVVVSNEPPHEVCVGSLAKFDGIARQQVDWIRDRIAHRMDRNDWVAEWQEHVMEWEPPRWAEFETANE